MKKALILLAAVGVAALSFAQGSEYVKGYTDKNGIYHPGYYRTKSNGTKTDNYGSKGNVNPFTGKKGTKDPYSTPRPRHRKGY